MVRENHPRGTTQGNRSLEGREEGWRVAKISYENLEDCTESWLPVRAKSLYNSCVFPPCMIIQIMEFLAEALPKVFSCVLCIDSSSSGYIVQLDI